MQIPERQRTYFLGLGSFHTAQSICIGDGVMTRIGLGKQFSHAIVRDAARFRFSLLQAFEESLSLFPVSAGVVNSEHLCKHQPLAEAVILSPDAGLVEHFPNRQMRMRPKISM